VAPKPSGRFSLNNCLTTQIQIDLGGVTAIHNILTYRRYSESDEFQNTYRAPPVRCRRGFGRLADQRVLWLLPILS
jgi:hypothetical protein